LAANSTQTEFSSRHDLATELVKLGIDPSTVEQLSIPTLGNLLTTLRRNLGVVQEKRKPGRPRGQTLSKNISSIDKKILKALLSSTGDVSSLSLSRELGIPLSTVQRRRKRLETYLLDMSYTLKVDKFGLRTADLFISTKNGMTDAVAKELLERYSAIASVSRTLGESTIDLKAKAVFRNNEDLANVIVKVSALDGVDKVSWNETVKVIGQNEYSLSIIIDSL
jgi:DNA-binding Lrp family transcriptional regulator